MSNYNNNNGNCCGKLLAALGLAALTGAAINQGVNDRRKEREKIAEKQRRLYDKLESQQEELEQLRKEQTRMNDSIRRGT